MTHPRPSCARLQLTGQAPSGLARDCPFEQAARACDKESARIRRLIEACATDEAKALFTYGADTAQDLARSIRDLAPA